MRAGLRARIWQNVRRVWAGCGPNDIVVGRMRAQLFQPAQFLSKFAHCLCMLVGGLSDSPLCLCMSCCACMRVCVHTFMRMCAFNYVMITCASQIHDVLVNDTLPVCIL